MSIPKEPRQMMINMMYLVLTALLALNVSAEILRAFMLVNRSLQKTSQILVDKNEIIYRQFENKLKEDPKKTKPFYDKAILVKQYCDDLGDLFFKLKDVLIDAGGNKNGWSLKKESNGDIKLDPDDFSETEGETDRIKGESNLDISSTILLVEGGGKKGKELREKIKETREKLLAIVENQADKERLTKTLPLAEPTDPQKKDGIQKTWQESLFGDIPLAAAVTLLSKFESDVKSTEAELINYLFSQISAADFKFDQLEAKIIANSTYVMVGQEYKAEIFVSAFSSTQNPMVFIGKTDEKGNLISKSDSLPVENGKGIYTVRPSSEGIQKYSGVIKIKGPTGEIQQFPFAGEYQVAKGSFVVSPDKMNVFYIGVDNPVSISVPGVPAENVKPSISPGSMSGGKGKYVVTVSQPGIAKVNVAVDLGKDAGGVKQMGTAEFRVKRVPDPIAMVGGIAGGAMKSGTFKAQTGMQAVLENFDFDIRFNIIEFEMSYLAKRQDIVTDKATGPLFGGRMKDYLERAKPGDVFIFENIKARGPDGVTRKLNSITFKLM